VAPGQPAVAVVSRTEWVQNNLASFSMLLEPIEARLDEVPLHGIKLPGAR
jgi:hypothetical protein